MPDPWRALDELVRVQVVVCLADAGLLDDALNLLLLDPIANAEEIRLADVPIQAAQQAAGTRRAQVWTEAGEKIAGLARDAAWEHMKPLNDLLRRVNGSEGWHLGASSLALSAWNTARLAKGVSEALARQVH